MTLSKQALSEALTFSLGPGWREIRPDDVPDNPKLTRSPQWEAIFAAARFVERLLPGECGNCQGRGWMADAYAAPEEIAAGYKRGPCPVCHSTGQLWDERLVEVVAREMSSTDSRAVLAALADEVGR